MPNSETGKEKKEGLSAPHLFLKVTHLRDTQRATLLTNSETVERA